MTCTQVVGRDQGGCAVTNFRDEGDPTARVANVGTVAMDISRDGVTQFYAFGTTGALIPNVPLDSEGPKSVPHVCVTCHAGSTSKIGVQTDLGSVFREFEPSVLDAPSTRTRPELDTSLFFLNQIVTAANGKVKTFAEGGPPSADHAAAAQLAYLNGMYASVFPPRAFDIHAEERITSSWRAGSGAELIAKRTLWTQVVNPATFLILESGTGNLGRSVRLPSRRQRSRVQPQRSLGIA